MDWAGSAIPAALLDVDSFHLWLFVLLFPCCFVSVGWGHPESVGHKAEAGRRLSLECGSLSLSHLFSSPQCECFEGFTAVEGEWGDTHYLTSTSHHQLPSVPGRRLKQAKWHCRKLKKP